MTPVHHGFGSTPRFSGLYKEVARNTDSTARLKYANYDPSLGIDPTEEQKELLQSFKPDMPTLAFTGSEKLHGENMAVCYSDGTLWVQGRNRINTVAADQNGMAQFVELHREAFLTIIQDIGGPGDTVILDGEWAGGNIQKGNAACSGTDKAFYMFDYLRLIDEDGDEFHYPTTNLSNHAESIYVMKDFKQYSVVLDFNNPSECEEVLEALALEIEANSPIAAHFNKPDNVGEGAYLWCLAIKDHPLYRLKTKGEKHGGKPKEKRDKSGPTSEEVVQLTAIADQLTPVWRITQGITETSATEMKDIGNLMKWVNQDIIKEEMEVITASGYDFKQLQKFTSKVVKDYFINSLKDY